MIAGFLLGGAVGTDRTAVGQTLLAHPAVAASLSGWMVGAPFSGIWCGLTLTLLAHSRLPLGHERLRDYASVAVAIPLALGPVASESDWGLALLLGVLWAKPLGWGILALREFGRVAQSRARELAAQGEVPPVERWHFSLAGLHFARGILAVLLTLVLLRLVLMAWHSTAGEAELRALRWLWVVAPALGLPVLLRARGRALWLVPGIAVGALLWWSQGGGG